jgi:LPXTG-motif cell wall-anchored protein
MDFNTLAQNIIDAHPESVRQLLAAKGIDKPATPLVLLQTYQIWGGPFLTELVDVIYEKSSNYIDPDTGIDSSLMDIDTSLPKDLQNQPGVNQISNQQATYYASVADGQQKSTLWSDLSSVFSSAAKVISSVKGTSTTSTGISANVNTPKTSNSGNTMLIIGIIVIVVLGVIIFIIKKKKK